MCYMGAASSIGAQPRRKPPNSAKGRWEAWLMGDFLLMHRFHGTFRVCGLGEPPALVKG